MFCCRECWEISSLWKSVSDIAAKAVENIINGGQSAANVVKLTKLLSAVALCASNISLQLSQSSSSLVFFGNNFYQNWNKLIREIDLNVIYLEVAKTSKYLASLGDMSMIDLREANSLLAFLSIPWLNKNIGAQLPLVDLSPYRVLANLQIFLDGWLINFVLYLEKQTCDFNINSFIHWKVYIIQHWNSVKEYKLLKIKIKFKKYNSLWRLTC